MRLDQAQQCCGGNRLPLLCQHARDYGETVPVVVLPAINTIDLSTECPGQSGIAVLHITVGSSGRRKSDGSRTRDVEANLAVGLNSQNYAKGFTMDLSRPTVFTPFETANIRLIPRPSDVVHFP
ncbi:hypothetical protein GCM10009687_60250 [Asanoa iriomotensis]